MELRVAALESNDATIPPAERDRILSARGISEEDLLDFVRARGAEPGYMLGVWEEIEQRLNADSVSVERPSPQG